jgi:hypothetical protein
VQLAASVYRDRKEIAEQKMKAVDRYAFDRNSCRLSMLLNYFGEQDVEACGVCDVCLTQRQKTGLEQALKQARLEKEEWRLEEIKDRFPGIGSFNEPVFREWIEHGEIEVIKPGLIRFTGKGT